MSEQTVIVVTVPSVGRSVSRSCVADNSSVQQPPVSMNVGVPPVVLKSARKHTATLIFLHGLGDTGMGWAGALNTIRPDYLKVIISRAANESPAKFSQLR